MENGRKKSYVTWSHAERVILIRRRIEEDVRFSGKNANSNEGWKKVAESFPETKDWISCKSQWNALVRKYKSFFRYRTGEGTGEEAVAEEAKDWEYFEVMHQYASQKDNYHPPYLVDSRDGEVTMRENSPTEPGSSDGPSCSQTSSFRRRARTPQLPSREERLHKLEQHIIKRDRHFKKKVGSLMAIFGQMVQTDYPNINVDALLVSSETDSD